MSIQQDLLRLSGIGARLRDCLESNAFSHVAAAVEGDPAKVQLLTETLQPLVDRCQADQEAMLGLFIGIAEDRGKAVSLLESFRVAAKARGVKFPRATVRSKP